MIGIRISGIETHNAYVVEEAAEKAVSKLYEVFEKERRHYMGVKACIAAKLSKRGG